MKCIRFRDSYALSARRANAVRPGLAGLASIVAALVILPVQADVTQTLDSVDAIGGRAVLEMQFGKNPPPYDDSGLVLPDGRSLAACQRAADRNLYCVLNSFSDGGVLRQPVMRWSETGSSEELFDCTDRNLGLDRRRANPCTSMTVDLSGDIWLGGRDGTAHSVIKVIEVPTTETCPSGASGSDKTDSRGFQPLTGDYSSDSNFCFRRYATGRPIIVDMTTIDARAGKGFQGPNGASGKGVLLLEDRKTVVFVADKADANGPLTAAPAEIATGKGGWALVGSESIQSATLLQLACTSSCNTDDDKDNYVLVTTSTGRVMAKRTDPLGASVPVVPAAASTCGSALSPQYSVRVSQQTGQVFVSDRSCQTVRSLTVSAPPPAQFAELASLSTDPATSATSSINSLSVSPGIGFDLTECFDEDCVLEPDGTNNNGVGAKMASVDIVLNGKSGLTAFRIRNIPDCRHLPAGSCPAGAVVEIDAGDGKGLQKYLDVAKLLPLEVMELFDETTSPPLSELELLIGPQYRARPPHNTFEGFFGRTEDGVVFRETFDVTFDVGELTQMGASRCGFQPTSTVPAPGPGSAANWDAVTTVSERYKTASVANGPVPATGGLRHVDMLLNTNCENPTAGAGVRWSLFAYGLMPSACVTDNAVDQESVACGQTFAHLLRELFDDLERARALTACQNPDGNTTGNPLGAAVCATLKSDWDATKPKLDSCINAALDKKQSAADENCQAFETQFLKFRTTLASASVNGGADGDIANRLGELHSRVQVLLYIYAQQFRRSIPHMP